MWCTKLILISCISLAASRPQNQQNVETKTEKAEAQVEIERQIIHEVIPLSDNEGPPNTHQSSQRKIDASTREILEKIAEINKKQGLLEKKAKPNYFHFPLSYSRSQDNEQGSNSFKFPRDPFRNPIFEYLEKEDSDNKKNTQTASFRRPNFDKQHDSEGFGFSATGTNPEISSEDNIPGQYVKRKITHYQSFLMPNPTMFNMGPSMPVFPSSIYPPVQPQASSNPQTNNDGHGYPMYSYLGPNIPINSPNLEQNKNKTSLEEQTVDNIKDIVLRNQETSSPMLPNYFYQAPQVSNVEFQNTNLNQQHYFKPYFDQSLPAQSNNVLASKPNKEDLSKFRMTRHPIKARQNWNWPGANLFPIYIRDPFLQMYYAVTNMVEYGPAAGNGGPCKLTPRPQGSRLKTNSKATSDDVNSKGQQVTFEMNKREGTDEIKVANIDKTDLRDDVPYLDVEEIDLSDDDLVKFTVNLPKSSSSGGRELKDDKKGEKMKWDEYIKLRNNTFLSQLVSGKLDFSNDAPPETKQSPSIKEQTLQIEELDDEPIESEKAEDISISNQGAKKVFSRDNTGNGIFIHKLKVRKGGVAIAGPGGIATAGSGGTAIVGPNGVAYTHPDGLAIAGSGTKVVAVDPKIDLNDVIKNTVLNGTRHVPNTRVGKVVAVGPVVYYNRG